MRATPFKQVFDKVVRLHGRDPRKEVPADMREALVDHINYRVSAIWQGWRWPEWEVTEERAFRPIWGSTEQYLLESIVDGNPDEVFYLGDSYVAGDGFGDNYGYYRVTATPPVGTLPTNESYWETMENLDTFIPYDQRDRRAIGMVLGIYSREPRVPTGSNYGRLRYTPSEKGIDVCCSGVPTVFITHKMPLPEYTMLPYAAGRTYVRADVVLDPASGECFQATRTTTGVPEDLTTTDDWNLVPFLDSWIEYVVKGAFADSLMEFDQGGNAELQAKMVLVQYWNQQADDALQSEVDALATQGQKLVWHFCKQRTQLCNSQPWTGGMVTLINQ